MRYEYYHIIYYEIPFDPGFEVAHGFDNADYGRRPVRNEFLASTVTVVIAKRD